MLKKLPREAPAMRKSPRIKERVILLDSDDSGPELLPVPVPQTVSFTGAGAFNVNKIC